MRLTAYRKVSITLPERILRFGQDVLSKEAVRIGEKPNFSAAVRMLIAREIETRNGAKK